MFGCQQVLINDHKQLINILEFICSEANKLTRDFGGKLPPKTLCTNCGIYYARQVWFKIRKYLGKFELINEYKTNPHYKVLHSQAAQQALLSVRESFKSYYELDKKFRNGELEFKPKLPNYRKKDGFAVVSYPKQALKLRGNEIEIPLGLTVSRWFGLKNFSVVMPSNLKFENIRELRILPRNRYFYVEFIYKLEREKVDVDFDKVIGIDHGLSNWLTCISNVGTSIIVDGKHLKSLNQFYNKQVSKLKDEKPQGFWSKRLAAITEKRNRQMQDAVDKAARIVINHCLNNKIGTVVFGWNQRQKDSSNMGRVNNQKFVSIPTAKLKNRVAQLCEQYGLKFVETEESYTSKASFVDNNFLPKFDEKLEGWKSSGKRVKRGLFRTALNQYINADCNGAANIIRKVSTTLGLNLSEVSSGALTTPLRIALW